MISRLFPAIIFLIAVGVFFGYINPTRTGSIAATKAQIASYEGALDAAERFKDKQSQLVVAKANIPSDKLARLETFLPDGVDNVQIILDLNALAARSGVTLSNFETATGGQQNQNSTNATPATSASGPGATGLPGAAGGLALETSSPIDSLEVQMTATGTYPAFRAFLTGIESSLRQLDVVEVTVKDSATGVYTYGMTVRLYWLR
jgi:hypothetical protein